MCICDLKPGEAGFVNRITGNEKLAKRLLALGCTAGTEITLKRVAPLGDPIVVNLRGTDFALRKKDAQYIFIK
ncbi:MAG: ferrous iron transport protein A [Clostridiaceae bacterium]